MTRTNDPIYVTKPYLPPLEEFIPYLETIWDRRVLTNGGPYHQELEKALGEYLGVAHISLFSNGTIALMTALQALDIQDEVITTPYSFVATSHALLWNNLKPVFVDIDPDTFNMDPGKIEAAITDKTSAILPVHCYGRPCDTDAIARIAEKHQLKVLYDAAHVFGVHTPEGNILHAGDMSILSFHATKVFNTFEGGAIVSPDAATKQHIDQLKNFGFIDETHIVKTGINGKMNEISAAAGLLQLRHLPAALSRRAEVDASYRRLLANIPGIHVPDELPGHNHAYFPILVRPDYALDRDGLYERLKQEQIYSRRYFYPLISQFPMYADLPSSAPANLPQASLIANQVLCLPIYPELTDEELNRIVRIIASP